MKQFCSKYGAYYDDEKDIWIGHVCSNKCDICKDRPEKPSSCCNDNANLGGEDED